MRSLWVSRVQGESNRVEALGQQRVMPSRRMKFVRGSEMPCGAVEREIARRNAAAQYD